MPRIENYISPSTEFDPAALAAMGDAYDRALASFSESPGQSVREALAASIIQLAQQGLLDPVKLCEEALAAYGLQSKCGGDADPRGPRTPT